MKHLVKILIFGSTVVGKSNILNRMVHNIFDDKSSATIIDFRMKDFILNDGSKLKIQFWDTSGNKSFR